MSETRPHPELPKDDRDWIELLRGREAPGTDPRTAAEARLLRGAIRAARPDDRRDSGEGLEPLLFRLKREGLLDAPKARRLRPLYAAAAAILIAALALPFMLQMRDAEEDEPYRTRSLGAPSVAVVAADPAKRAAEIAEALRAAGAQVRSSESGGGTRLDVTVPPENRDAVRQALIRQEIRADPQRRLRIDVRPLPVRP